MKARSVLVIDDDPAIREMIVCLLRDQGLEVQSAASVDEAHDMIQTVHFDAVLSDIQMPGKSGWELAKELRHLRLATQLILMTGSGHFPTAAEVRQVGACDCLKKPFTGDQLFFILERALQRVSNPAG